MTVTIPIIAADGTQSTVTLPATACRTQNRARAAEDVAEPAKAKGLWTRLDSHASGRRSGDQFCV